MSATGRVLTVIARLGIFTVEDLVERSGVPEATVRAVLRQNPTFVREAGVEPTDIQGGQHIRYQVDPVHEVELLDKLEDIRAGLLPADDPEIGPLPAALAADPIWLPLSVSAAEAILLDELPSAPVDKHPALLRAADRYIEHAWRVRDAADDTEPTAPYLDAHLDLLEFIRMLAVAEARELRGRHVAYRASMAQWQYVPWSVLEPMAYEKVLARVYELAEGLAEGSVTQEIAAVPIDVLYSDRHGIPGRLDRVLDLVTALYLKIHVARIRVGRLNTADAVHEWTAEPRLCVLAFDRASIDDRDPAVIIPAVAQKMGPVDRLIVAAEDMDENMSRYAATHGATLVYLDTDDAAYYSLRQEIHRAREPFVAEARRFGFRGARPRHPQVQVRSAALGQLSLLAESESGRIFRADGFHLPGDPTQLVYKQFTGERAEQARSAQAAIAFRAELSPAERAELDYYSMWPRALVEDASGSVCGVLMPLIPEEYFCRQIDPDSGQVTTKPREMSWLIARAEQREAAQIDLPEVDATVRLILLAQLVYAIGQLHKYGWVFGNLSFTKVVFALDPPRLMVLDCDGAAAMADARRKQFSTPYWDPPECLIQPLPREQRQQKLQDEMTDSYKLGLAILRCLTPGRGASTARSVRRLNGELNADGIGLVDRALSADRDRRPTAKEMYGYLCRILSTRIALPEVAFARLATPYCLRSQDARIEWKLEKAANVTVSVGDSLTRQVDPAAHPNGCVFRPDESGPVSIEVRNRFGTVSMDLGEVTLHNLSLESLPIPEIRLEAIFLEPMRAVLATVPRVGAGFLEMPALNTVDLMESLIADIPSTVISGMLELRSSAGWAE